MDHLWLDADAMRRPDLVPVLGLVQYDGSNQPPVFDGRYPGRKGLWFYNFVHQHGYNENSLISTIFPRSAEEYFDEKSANSRKSHQRVVGRKPHTGLEDDEKLTRSYATGPDIAQSSLHSRTDLALSVLQEWLYFGLLIDFAGLFDVSIYREELTVERNGSEYACTERLQNIFERIVRAYTDAALDFDSPAVSALFRGDCWYESLPSKIRTKFRTVMQDEYPFQNRTDSPLRDRYRNLLESLTMAERTRITHILKHVSFILRVREEIENMTQRAILFLERCVAEGRASELTDSFKGIWLSAATMVEAIAAWGLALLGPSLGRFSHAAVTPPAASCFWLHGSGLCLQRLQMAAMIDTAQSYMAALASKRRNENHDMCTAEQCLHGADDDIGVCSQRLLCR